MNVRTYAPRNFRDFPSDARYRHEKMRNFRDFPSDAGYRHGKMTKFPPSPLGRAGGAVPSIQFKYVRGAARLEDCPE